MTLRTLKAGLLLLSVVCVTGCRSTTSYRPACCPTGAVVAASPVPCPPPCPTCPGTPPGVVAVPHVGH